MIVFLVKISLHDPPGNVFEPDDETKRTKMVLNTHVIVRKILTMIDNHNLEKPFSLDLLREIK